MYIQLFFVKEKNPNGIMIIFHVCLLQNFVLQHYMMTWGKCQLLQDLYCKIEICKDIMTNQYFNYTIEPLEIFLYSHSVKIVATGTLIHHICKRQKKIVTKRQNIK